MKQIREKYVRLPGRVGFNAELTWQFTVCHYRWQYAYDHEGD